MELQTAELVEEDLIVLNASQQLVSLSSARLSTALGYVLMGEDSYADVFQSYEPEIEKLSAQILAFSSDNDAVVCTKYYGDDRGRHTAATKLL